MLMQHTTPVIAIATAPGRGAVGIVRLSGRGLERFAQQLCQRTLVPRMATYLPIQGNADSGENSQVIDHGLALFFPAPHSYTGEDVLELQVHGGPVVLQLLLAHCLALAAKVDEVSGQPLLVDLRLARPGEFTERAFLNGKLDLAQAEAVADLIDASTEAAARSASRSLAGVFSQQVNALRDGLINLRMLVEATLDFPEEEIDFLSKADASGKLARLQSDLLALQQRTKQGALLREGIKVVIAGQPNAGKSSLLNALAGAELAIVTPIAGTTRDKVSQTIQIEGVPLHVVDTAGLRESGDVVERIGIERAWDEISSADVVLFLHDLTRKDDYAYAEEDDHIAQRLPEHVPRIDLWNKSDAAAVTENADSDEEHSDELYLSAKTGEGLDALRKHLLETVGWRSADEGIFMARERHVQALAAVAGHLDVAEEHLSAQAQSLDLLAEELRLAQQALNEITGEFTSDDLLGEIFSRFCIGK